MAEHKVKYTVDFGGNAAESLKKTADAAEQVDKKAKSLQEQFSSLGKSMVVFNQMSQLMESFRNTINSAIAPGIALDKQLHDLSAVAGVTGDGLKQIEGYYEELCPERMKDEVMEIVRKPITKQFYYSKKLNALLDLDVKLFNHVVFKFLQTTEYPVGKLTEEEFPLLDNDDVLVKEDIFRLLRESGVGVPAYYEEIPFEVDGKTGTYCRSRSGCYFCFFQQRIEWVWLLEQHPDLYEKAMTFEKDGYTWIQGETLADLARPERVRQIKLDIIKKQEAAREKNQGTTLVDILGDDIMCTNCFI